MCKKLIFASFLLFSVGCIGATEGDKQVNAQNYLAGKFIEQNAKSEVVKQAGKDVSDNAEELSKSIGIPKNPPSQYSPEASAQARDQAKKEREEESGIFTSIKSFVSSNVPYGGLALLIGGFAWKLGRKLIHTKKKLSAVYAGVQNIFKDAKNGGKDPGALVETMTDTMRTTAGLYNVYEDIKADLKELKSKGVLKSNV